jgi:hypothetical protein
MQPNQCIESDAARASKEMSRPVMMAFQILSQLARILKCNSTRNRSHPKDEEAHKRTNCPGPARLAISGEATWCEGKRKKIAGGVPRYSRRAVANEARHAPNADTPRDQTARNADCVADCGNGSHRVPAHKAIMPLRKKKAASRRLLF